jgi:hypothetical protein
MPSLALAARAAAALLLQDRQLLTMSAAAALGMADEEEEEEEEEEAAAASSLCRYRQIPLHTRTQRQPPLPPRWRGLALLPSSTLASPDAACALWAILWRCGTQRGMHATGCC